MTDRVHEIPTRAQYERSIRLSERLEKVCWALLLLTVWNFLWSLGTAISYFTN